ncbi:MAG: ABC transporter substrate-binding protein [Actinomycetia bacterium]|nr:ABC transporter substrate-binding protein [Actinomycetes bacterium]
MYKKLGAVVLAFVLVLTLALTGCSAKKDTTGTTGSGDTGGTIKVGANYELSGAVATYGNDSLNGFKMAIDEVNKAGGVLGKQIEVISKDNKSDPAQATAAAQALASQGVSVMVGPATSGNFRATLPVAESSKIPAISSSATADDDITVDKATGKTRQFVFRTCFTDSFQGKIMANYASKKLGGKTAVIYADNSSDYAKGLAANFKKQFTANGGTIVAEEAYVAGDKDFSAVLTSLKAKQFDVMFVPGYYQEAGLIIKQARGLGMTQPILGADGFDSPDLASIAGASNVNDVYFSNHYSSLDKSAATQDFITAYKAANNGAEPNAFVAMGYDLGKYVVDAITRANSADPVKIADALSSTTSFTGATGTFSVGPDHNVIKSAVVIKMTNGKQASAEPMSVDQ